MLEINTLCETRWGIFLRQAAVVWLAALVLLPATLTASSQPKSVLIVAEGGSSLKNHAVGMGRQLGALMGHFNTAVTIEGVNEYTPHQMDAYDFTFYVGFHTNNAVPQKFSDDVLRLTKRVIWIATGMKELSQRPGTAKRLGFTVSKLDTATKYDVIRYAGKVFTKKEPALSIVEMLPRSPATVVATVACSTNRQEHPYIINTGSFTYIADSPFAYADEATEYLLFSDMLHDILGEQHEESHSALIRIEDVTPMENPDRLRDIADILSSRNIPFLVGVVPFYVNPTEGVRVSLSDKPEIVDALKYMVQNGATIVMHGVTHQYRGITAVDYEFWDENANGVIKGETVEGISRKLDMGIQEFMKNGLYPMLWETPHYTASFLLYQTVTKYFSASMEQRLSMEDIDYSQSFPYMINSDLFGQKIFPENLGYVPLNPDMETSRGYVQQLIAGAKDELYVRDGFASCFFHAFDDHELLKELVDGIQALGYTYLDLRETTNWVKTRDRVILTGSQRYSINLDDQYLAEAYYERNGDLIKRSVTEDRLKGQVSRAIELELGQFYRAEPTEFHEKPVTFVERLTEGVSATVRKVFGEENTWQQARPIIFWNHHARGAAFNDQASLAAVFGSVNIPMDTLFVGQPVTAARLSLERNNLLIVPMTFVDSLGQDEYDVVKKFVEDGGCLITDGRNDLAEEFGFKFSETKLKTGRVRDRLFPEERINWRYPQLSSKFETGDVDEVLCVSEASEAPLVVGKQIGHGRMLFFSTMFDPQSQLGYSQYPYLMEYVRHYFRLGPIVRQDKLEVLFDPGFRHNVSVETLVRQWISAGIRVVHVAGWHEYPKYTYDYGRLISLAHANGILVDAWLWLPQVSQKFWNEHPEWREKNFRGEDARPSWRYPVAITDKKCFDSVLAHVKALLDQFDWDGVNLAELYFDSGRGLADSVLYTPMHPSAREGFRKRYGFDPATVFDHGSPNYWRDNFSVRTALAEFRVQKLHEAYIQLLDLFGTYAVAKPGFEVMVTAMDNYNNPELREWIGADMSSVISLQRKYGFSLSVEDPQAMWSTTPLRYVGIGRQYSRMVNDSTKLALDLNIGNFRQPEQITPFPTTIQTGTESFQMIKSAAAGASRTVVYSESSVNPQDLIFFPFALARAVTMRVLGEDYEFASPSSFSLKLPKAIVEVRIDGVSQAPGRENSFLIPAGEHTIVLSTEHRNLSAYELQPRIVGINANLLSAAYDQRMIRFAYESSMRTLVSINRSPERIKVDGEEYTATAMKGNDCYTVFLPPGTHSVEMIAGDPFSYGVSLTSFWSSTVIAMFGTIAVLLLVAMYAIVIVVRRRFRKVEPLEA